MIFYWRSGPPVSPSESMHVLWKPNLQKLFGPRTGQHQQNYIFFAFLRVKWYIFGVNRFEPHWRHCVAVSLLSAGSTEEKNPAMDLHVKH